MRLLLFVTLLLLVCPETGRAELTVGRIGSGWSKMDVLPEQPAPAGEEAPPYHKALAWNLPRGASSAPAEVAAVAPSLRDPAEAPGESTEKIPAGKLTLADFVRLVMTNNQQIQGQKALWDIQKAEVEKARGIFEPRLVSSLQLEDRSQRNTAEQSASRQFTLTYEERNWDFSAAVQGLLPTGGQIQLGYDYRRLSNTLTRTLTDEEREYQMFLGITLTQPLLKNAGISVTMSGIRVAEAESQVAFQEYRQEMMRIVGETAARYWNFYQAQEKLRMREESLRVAEQILRDSEERFRIGKMARTEVLEAKAGVISRLALRSEARQEHLEAVNRLRTLVAMAAEGGTAPLEAGDSPKAETSVPDLQAMRQSAFRLRPEYLAAQKKIERAGLKVAYARNQRWPELDLKASFGLNGLDFSRGDSWEQIEDSRFDDWSIGLELNLPLLGNRAGTSELEKANLEKKRALLMLKAIEVELTNGIDTAVHNVNSAAEQADYAGDVVEIHKQLLDAEIARLEAGKSNSRLVLEKEENYRKAQEASLKNLVNLQKALVSLEVAGGMVLMNHGVELMEVEL